MNNPANESINLTHHPQKKLAWHGNSLCLANSPKIHNIPNPQLHKSMRLWSSCGAVLQRMWHNPMPHLVVHVFANDFECISYESISDSKIHTKFIHEGLASS